MRLTLFLLVCDGTAFEWSPFRTILPEPTALVGGAAAHKVTPPQDLCCAHKTECLDTASATANTKLTHTLEPETVRVEKNLAASGGLTPSSVGPPHVSSHSCRLWDDAPAGRTCLALLSACGPAARRLSR